MSSNTLQTSISQIPNENQFKDSFSFVAKLKNSVWIFGIHSWLFGIADRGFASFTDGYISAIELIHLFTASFFFVGWMCLKPDESFNGSGLATLQRYQAEASYYLGEEHLQVTRSRMAELQEYHLINQEYILPFPYLCQIYHLLNLKHLESIHSFSLNNLKVVSVSHFQPTDIGGLIKFETTLDSPFNALRVWRPPLVEVELILHTPYTVELNIPVYGNKYIVVIFNVLPLSSTEHKFFIDIYSNLNWPRPLLQILLHVASCLTLFEDLPYLRKLAERNIQRLVNLSRLSNQEATWLYRRFVELYGSSIEPSPKMRTVEVAVEEN